MTAFRKAQIKNKLKIIKTHNLTKAGIIFESQIRNKKLFLKTLTLHNFLLTVFFTASLYAKNVQLC